jgi:hypothetical protein
MPEEDISNGPEDLGFNIINVKWMKATRTAHNGKTHVNFSLYSMLA